MISTIIIDGAIKLAIKTLNRIGKTKHENRVRIYNPANSAIPEQVLYESATAPGTFLDEVNDKVYKLVNNKLVAI